MFSVMLSKARQYLRPNFKKGGGRLINNRKIANNVIGCKIYPELRTGMIEQCSTYAENIIILYRKSLFDFHDSYVEKFSVKNRKCSRIGVLFHLLMNDFRIVELTEPLFLREILNNLMYSIFLKIKSIVLMREMPSIVTYCIENVDMSEKVKFHLGRKMVFVWPIIKLIILFNVKMCSKIAFGTPSAKEEYFSLFGSTLRKKENKEFNPAEGQCPSCFINKKRRQSIVFIGSLDDRKGIKEVMEVWPVISRELREADLTIVGKGYLEKYVIDWSLSQINVRVIVNPDREYIHEVLVSSETLILPSVSSVVWREQIGLPITEGLSHGCKIISTNTTGISQFLRENGHLVVSNLIDSTEEIIRFIKINKTPLSILKSLPLIGGREEAELWLWK